MSHSHDHCSSKETVWTMIVIMAFVVVIVGIVETHRTEIEAYESGKHHEIE